MTSWPDALAPFRARPERSVLVFDYDGTLSPIVEVPEAAVPAPGAVELLDELISRYGTVAVVSGRSVDFLADRLPAGLVLSGIYGLESRRDGVRVDHPSAGRGGRWSTTSPASPSSAAPTACGSSARVCR